MVEVLVEEVVGGESWSRRYLSACLMSLFTVCSARSARRSSVWGPLSKPWSAFHSAGVKANSSGERPLVAELASWAWACILAMMGPSTPWLEEFSSASNLVMASCTAGR